MKKINVGTIICIILLIIMLPILILNCVILVKSWIKPDEVPSFMGYKPFIVLSGSMEPTIMTGDLAISKVVDDTNNLKVGDIISFKTADNIVITHRIVEIDKDGTEKIYITKGDNNNEKDSEPVTASMIEGIYVTKINGLGNIAMFIQKPVGFIIVASVPVITIIIAQCYSSRQYKKELEELKEKANKK